VSIKYAILGLLSRKDLHGYAIKKRIERDFGHMWTANYGQIYPALRDLEEEGLVTMIEQVQPRSPTRKMYAITARGREVFRRWLDETPEKRLTLRDPFLLRFTFFGQGDPAAALRSIDEQVALYDAQLRGRREALLRWRQNDPYVRMASELGVELNEMIVEWLRRARAEIESGRVDEGETQPVALASRTRRRRT
jgi:DNA-binding PadR family transcriptional regulator